MYVDCTQHLLKYYVLNTVPLLFWPFLIILNRVNFRLINYQNKKVYIQKKTYLLSTDPNFYQKLRREIPNKAKVLPKVQEFTNITCNDLYWNKLRSQKTKNQKCHMVFVSHQRKRGFVLFNFVVSGHIAIHLMQWL